jgi:DNA polymerase-1
MTNSSFTHSTRNGETICIVDLAQIEARLNSCYRTPNTTSFCGTSPASSYTTSDFNANKGMQSAPAAMSNASDTSHCNPTDDDACADLGAVVRSDVSDGSQGALGSEGFFGLECTCPSPLNNGHAVESGVINVRVVRAQGAETSCIIKSPEHLPQIAAAIKASSKLALDIETYGYEKNDGLDPWKGDIRLLTLGVQGHPPWLLDLREIGYQLGELQPALQSAEVIVHNANFDLLWLAEKCGIRITHAFCTLTAARLLSAGTRQGNDLDQCLQRDLGVPAGPDMSKSDWGSLLLTEQQIRYAARDVVHLDQLADRQRQLLEEAGLLGVFRLEMDLLPAIVAMELSGMGVDRERLTLLRDRSQKEAQENTQNLRQLLNAQTLNPNSPKQLVAALERAGLATESTDEESLLKINDGKIIPVILRFRRAEKSAQQATKLLGTIAHDGRIHGRFDPTGTMTGRFSSSRPNLQNIGRGPLRECFVPAKNHKLIVADYSQVELRLASVIAGEKKMISAYQDGYDLHRETAAAVLGKPLEQITKEDRQLAKAVNFGLLYGQGAEGLVKYAAANYGVTLTSSEAKIIHARFFEAYPALGTWHRQCWRSAAQGSLEARTVLNRRRLVPSVATDWERFTALVNTPVQGGSADGLKRAMLRIHNTLPTGARLICTVHDEIIVEAPEALAASVCELVRATMRDEMALLFPAVPIEVEAQVCENWGQK